MISGMIGNKEYVEEQLPYFVLLPGRQERPEYYEVDNSTLRISNDMFGWLEELCGQGTENDHALKILLKRAQWWVRNLRHDPNSVIFENVFAVRFRNEEDATLFKLTWL